MFVNHLSVDTNEVLFWKYILYAFKKFLGLFSFVNELAPIFNLFIRLAAFLSVKR